MTTTRDRDRAAIVVRSKRCSVD